MQEAGTKGDWRFCGVVLRVLGFKHLTIREARYLILRFYFRMKDREIAKYDSIDVSHQAINLVIMKAYRKIKAQGWHSLRDNSQENIFKKRHYFSNK